MLAWTSLAQTVTVSSWGGLYGESQRKAYFEPFTAATGIQVLEDDWGGDLDKVRAMVATGRYQAHVLDAESGDVVQGCAEGIFEPIDYGKLGLSPQDMLPGAAHLCGVGIVAWSMVLVFDRARLATDSPESWTDFFDLTRFPRRTRSAARTARQPRNRVDGRRSAAGGCLPVAAHRGGSRPRLCQARDDCAARNVVGSRSSARQAPGRRRKRR